MAKLRKATKSGNTVEQLEVLAEILADRIDNAEEGDNVASLARQYRETLRELKEAREMEEDDTDEISAIIGQSNSVRPRHS